MTTEMNDVTNHQPNRKSNDENIMAMLIYLLSLFTSIIGPLIIWLLKKDESKLVDRAGKNYLNYTISYIIWSIVLVVITLIGVFLIATDIDFIIIIGSSLRLSVFYPYSLSQYYLLYSQLLRVSNIIMAKNI